MNTMERPGFWAAATLAVVAAFAAKAQCEESPLPPRPIEILKSKSTCGPTSRVVDTSASRIWIDWSGFTRDVYIYRSSRTDSREAWPEPVVQEVATSFTITDVVALCDTDPDRLRCLYVSGFYWAVPAQSTIERWTFVAPPGSDASAPPEITKSVVYRGELGGVVSNIAIECDERRAFVLTWKENELYEIALPDGTPTSIVNQATAPELVRQRSIFYRRHVTEGPKYMLSSMGGNNHSIRVYTDDRTILLSDTDDDGAIDTVELLTDQAWRTRGYDDPSVWIEGPSNG